MGNVEACRCGVFEQLKNSDVLEKNALYRCSTVQVELNTNTHVNVCAVYSIPIPS